MPCLLSLVVALGVLFDGGGCRLGGPPPGAGEEQCSPVVEFSPDGATASWRHKRTGLLVVTQGAPRHRGQDIATATGKPQVLMAKFAYGPADKDLEDEDVEIFVQRSSRCNPWELLGSAKTSKDGQFGDKYGIEDDGGRVFFEGPAAKALGFGRHHVKMRVTGDHSTASFNVFILRQGAQVVVFDIDGTLTTSDSEVFKEVLSDIVKGDYKPEVRKDSPRVASAWADKDYLPVYVTGRPDLFREISAAWLDDQGFPRGPVHCTDELSEAVPSKKGVAKYKTAFLARLQQSGLSIAAAYGNAETDIVAYENAGIPKDRTFIVGPNAGKGGTVAIDTYTEHLSTVKDMPDAER